MWSSRIAEYGTTGYGCQSRSWLAEQGKRNISMPPFAPENLFSRDGLGCCSVPRQPAHAFSTLRMSLVFTQGVPPDFRCSVHLFSPPSAIGSVPSLSGHAVAHRWRSPPRVPRHRARCPRGSSSNGYFSLKFHLGSINNVHLSFPMPIIGIKGTLFAKGWLCLSDCMSTWRTQRIGN